MIEQEYDGEWPGSVEASQAKVLLDKAGARRITRQIRKATEHLWELLVEAHEGQAWRALATRTGASTSPASST